MVRCYLGGPDHFVASVVLDCFHRSLRQTGSQRLILHVSDDPLAAPAGPSYWAGWASSVRQTRMSPGLLRHLDVSAQVGTLARHVASVDNVSVIPRPANLGQATPTLPGQGDCLVATCCLDGTGISCLGVITRFSRRRINGYAAVILRRAAISATLILKSTRPQDSTVSI